jgi:hypothetical protein
MSTIAIITRFSKQLFNLLIFQLLSWFIDHTHPLKAIPHPEIDRNEDIEDQNSTVDDQESYVVEH